MEEDEDEDEDDDDVGKRKWYFLLQIMWCPQPELHFNHHEILKATN